eukprot:Sspe_Gene.30748::Locus_15195_Transcript_2_3_Confidence_0.333_Length_584::g.30748::m.30748
MLGRQTPLILSKDVEENVLSAGAWGVHRGAAREHVRQSWHAGLAEKVKGRTFRIGERFKAVHAKLTGDQLAWMLGREEVDFVEPNQVVRAIGGAKRLSCPNLQREPLSWGQKRVTEPCRRRTWRRSSRTTRRGGRTSTHTSSTPRDPVLARGVHGTVHLGDEHGGGVEH